MTKIKKNSIVFKLHPLFTISSVYKTQDVLFPLPPTHTDTNIITAGCLSDNCNMIIIIYK